MVDGVCPFRRGGARVRSRAFLLAATLLAFAAPARADVVRKGPGSMSSAGFAMPKNGAEQYGPSQLTCATGGLQGLLESQLAEQAKKAGKPAPQADGPLCAAAEAFLGWTEPQLPADSVRRFAAWHYGMASPIARIFIDTVDTEDFRNIADRLVQLAASYTGSFVAPRFGVASQRVRRETTKLVLVLQDAPAELKPVPRRVPANGEVTIEGRLLGDYDDPQLLASNTVGKLETVEAKGKTFRAKFACGERPGRLQIELRADRGGGPTTLANFPVACGIDVPTVVKVAPAPAKGAGPDVAAAARKMLELMNADRSAVGLPALAWDDSVAAVAKDAAEYLRGAMSGKASGAPFDLRAMLKSKDVGSSLVLQNPVAGLSVEEAHDLVSINPVDRANVLSTEATHCGIGAVAATDGTPVLFFSTLLVKEMPPFDPAAVTVKLGEAIARRRADARAHPLAADPVLTEVAGKYATELAASRGTIAPAKESEITAPLYKGFRTVNVISGVKTDPLEFAEESGIVGDAELVGVGVARGTSPNLGKNSAFVVILTGSRHKAQDANKSSAPKAAPPPSAKKKAKP